MISVINLPLENFKLLWANDVHYDSVHCKREQFKNDCKIADKIILSGDFWDLMEGINDKRKSGKDKEFHGSYINDLVSLGCEALKPFKDKIIGWNAGNHELSFKKYSDCDITGLVCDRLGIAPIRRGMRGYYIFNFKYGKEVIHAIRIYYQHNSGSNGKRSKGSLAADILAGEHPSADIWITEHSHRGVIVPLKSANISKLFDLSYKMKYFIQGLSYKAEDEDNNGESFGINKGFGLLPIGGVFLDFERLWDGSHPRLKINPYFKI
jgi:hypothetical protein